MGLVHDAEVAREQTTLGRVSSPHLPGGEEQVVVGDLEIKLVGVGRIAKELRILALIHSGTVMAGAFDTNTRLDVGTQLHRVEIQGFVQQIRSSELLDCVTVQLRVAQQRVHIFVVPLGAEVVFFAFAEDCCQRLTGQAEVLKHIRKCGDLFLHDGHLQLNAGSGDGHRVPHKGIGLIEELGYEASDQVSHGLAGSNLRFAEGSFLGRQTSVDGLGHLQLLLTDCIPILGHDYPEDDVDEIGRRIGTSTFVPLVAVVLDGIENLGDDERILIFSDGRFPFHDR